MREAFGYMFKDNCFFKKAIIYYLLTFLSCVLFAYAEINSCSGSCAIMSKFQVSQFSVVNLMILRVVAFLLTFFTAGYFFTCVKALSEQSNNYVLPLFNYGVNFVKGLKFALGAFITILLCSIILALLGLLGAKVTIISMYTIVLLYLFFAIAFSWRFANGGTFLTLLNWKGVIKTVLSSPKKYFKHFLIVLLIVFLSALISYLIEYILNMLISDILITMLLSVFINTFLEVYIAFVLMFLTAKSIAAKTVV